MPARWIPLSLFLTIILWGANNVALKEVVEAWPPLWAGSTRFLIAGVLLGFLLRHTRWFGPVKQPDRQLRSRLWWSGGLSLAVYIVACNWTLRFIPASHFAMEMATVPIFALLIEPQPKGWGLQTRRWSAALLAFGGVGLLIGPTLQGGGAWYGELMGLGCALLWVLYSRQCRFLAVNWNGPAVTAHTMWRAGVLMAPLSLIEMAALNIRPDFQVSTLVLHAFCITLGGIAPFALWNNALAHWPVSRVALFGNLIPVSTMGWAYLTLGESIPSTSFLALLLILAGVLIGQGALHPRLKRWMRI